jgi:hypothetical protein
MLGIVSERISWIRSGARESVVGWMASVSNVHGGRGGSGGRFSGMGVDGRGDDGLVPVLDVFNCGMGVEGSGFGSVGGGAGGGVTIRRGFVAG